MENSLFSIKPTLTKNKTTITDKEFKKDKETGDIVEYWTTRIQEQDVYSLEYKCLPRKCCSIL